jgi:hypothetical protein
MKRPFGGSKLDRRESLRFARIQAQRKGAIGFASAEWQFVPAWAKAIGTRRTPATPLLPS